MMSRGLSLALIFVSLFSVISVDATFDATKQIQLSVYTRDEFVLWTYSATNGFVKVATIKAGTIGFVAINDIKNRDMILTCGSIVKYYLWIEVQYWVGSVTVGLFLGLSIYQVSLTIILSGFYLADITCQCMLAFSSVIFAKTNAIAKT